MADFIPAFNKTIASEGGYLDLNTSDAGNWTSGKVGVGELVGSKWGITPIDYKQFYGKQSTRDIMANLTIQQAQAIYKNLYWDKIHGDDIVPQHIAEELFDAAVNTGLGSVSKLAAEALNIPQTTKSGLDEKTINILNSLSNEKIIDSGNNLA